jgi:poly(hydroxyalkanoate) granule-associated protein
MSTDTVEVETTQAKHADLDTKEMARKVWLAGLGAVVMARDEIQRMAKQCVERGEMTEKESRKLVVKAKALPEKSLKSAEGRVDRQVDALLNRLGIVRQSDLQHMDLPSRGDIEALGEKVAALTRKVEQLRRAEDVQAREIAALRKIDEKPEPVTN